MSKIKYLSDKAIDWVQVNMDVFKQEMPKHSDSSWLKDSCHFNPFITSDYELEDDFELKISGGDPSETDCENAIRIYEAFKKAGLTNVVVYDPRFIPGFILTRCYEYYLQRWGAKHASDSLFFPTGPRRSIARNAIGRLYQWVCLSIDSESEDPYELTKFGFEHPAVFRIGFYPCFDGKNVSLSYFKALKQWCDSGNRLPGIDKLIRHLTLLCNVNVAENMDEIDIINYILDYLNKTIA